MIAGAIPRSGWLLPDYKFGAPNSNSNPRNKTHFAERNIILPSKLSLQVKPASFFSTKAVSSSSVGNTEYAEEPATNVQFQTSLSLPGCSSLLSLIGIGYREKVFAIIGVKVYAAGLYINPSILNNIKAWRGRSATEIQDDSSFFDIIYHGIFTSLEKSLQIILARDVEGKTFWDALDEAVSPRIKSPTSVDQTALDTFRSVFQGRPLKKGTFIFLTWLNPAKMMIHLSAGETPSAADATIESENVAFALFDVFLGRDPVSPSLKASVSNGLASALN